MIDLTELGLTEAQRAAVEGVIGACEARAEEAFHQLADARAEVYAHRFGARDAAVAARLVDADGDLEAQFQALRKASPYLFEGQTSQSGGARLERRPPDARPDMNSVLRGR